MKALTVKQPWAWAITHGGKDVENRTRRTNYRGKLYIHAGKAWDEDGLLAIGLENMPADEALPAGHVIGTVEVLGCHHADDCRGSWGPDLEGTSPEHCSKWAQPGTWHWELTNPRPLACSFPEKGKLGIWNLLPQEVT